ncbi:UvrD-helicase domain-containing protein [Uliginosibacterium gangwonense]|uniref:UvrD-helicase domain-containing protein n=1 Tax=Uliginosibacterium gangwonense TaxID=392736 RepID=UPI00036330A2|nr:UvrD-helicase domain-containing protein [Uliginosibacterium gangwonense]
MSALQRQQQRFHALVPAHSVAVEACAGSGKTWLLTSRLLCLLLDGARPGQILAITYTRKAAREIEARLRGLLAMLATAEDGRIVKELCERGLSQDEAQSKIVSCRSLFESVLHADPPITITTFHGWFARLLGGAPLDSGLAGRSLDEGGASLLDEAWVVLAAECSRAPEKPMAQSLLWLYAELGAWNTRKLLRRFVDRRAEWHVWQNKQGDTEGALAWSDAVFGVGFDVLARFFNPNRLQDFADFATALTGTGAAGAKMATAIQEALACAEWPEAFAILASGLLTGKGEPRALKPVKAYQALHGEAGVEQLLRRFAELCEALTEAQGALRDQDTGELNRHALMVGDALLAKLAHIKQSRRIMDFSDLEAEIDGLLAREGSAAYLQARLDARYKHILLDEFQDTNPLQWRILRGWLDAYASAGVTPPSVFLVGDPKQSIYRFRRAEPKLFTAAARYFEKEFGASHQSNAHTFRNAPVIVDLVNELFAAEPLFEGFTPQTTEWEALPGKVEVLPLIPVNAADASAGGAEDTGFRLPLESPRLDVEDQRRAAEAAILVERVQAMVGEAGPAMAVRGKDRQERPARYSDILILTRRTTQLAVYEAALRHAGIPFVSPGRGGLLNTLEAQDLLATLRFLADPGDNLALAQVLRMPAFGLGDDVLLALSAQPGQAWWHCLQKRAKQEDVGEEVGDMAAQEGAERRAVRLLRRWLDASQYLPAHDLIDRMFHEAQWLERCRAVLPPALWPGVHANLEALLELSLNVDAGRYPSLTRFVDELRRLSSTDEEAPDEGLIASVSEGLGRVRIMTIHGAKGLEAPIVWLIDANSNARPPEGFDVAQDWPADELSPEHFSLIGSLGAVGQVHVPILTREREAALREELNLLYVAITRAEQVLFVSGVESARNTTAATAYSRVAAAVERLGSETGVWGDMPEQALASPAEPQTAGDGSGYVPIRIGEQRPAQVQIDHVGMAFGTALHAWLEAYTRGVPTPESVPEVVAAARGILRRPHLAKFFDPAGAYKSGSEVSFVAEDGSIGRIDRWVDDGEMIWILDYKSGGRPEQALLDSYRSQLATYCRVMRQIFSGRIVKALLIFTDAGELEV